MSISFGNIGNFISSFRPSTETILNAIDSATSTIFNSINNLSNLSLIYDFPSQEEVVLPTAQPELAPVVFKDGPAYPVLPPPAPQAQPPVREVVVVEPETGCGICSTIWKIIVAIASFFVWIVTYPFREDPAEIEVIPANEVMSLQERKEIALLRLDAIEKGEVQFDLYPSLQKFDLDSALRKYSSNYSVDQWMALYDIGMPDDGSPEQRIERQQFKQTLRRYDSWFDSSLAKRYLANLCDLLEQKNLAVEKNPQKAALFRQEIQSYVSRIVDAHTNCPDQVYGQLETILVDAVAGAETIGTEITPAHLRWQTAAALFTHRSNVVNQIVIRQNPDEYHMADLARAVKQRLAKDLNLRAEINEQDPYYTPWGARSKARAVKEEFKRVYNDPTSDSHPLSYILTNTPHIWARNSFMRRNFIQWAYNHYDLDSNTEMVKRFSVDKNNDPFVNSGDLTDAATLLLLEEAGIIREKK